MNNTELNILQLEGAAQALADLLPQVTFVGGCTTALLVDAAAQFGVRHTDDVDAIIDVATRVEYHRFAQALRERGFREDTDGPICRWLRDTNAGPIKLDVMPTSEALLGFSNRWYKASIAKALLMKLPSGIPIRVVSPPYFIATKFEAFAGRGNGDFYSHDMEDIVFVLENRTRLIVELSECSKELKQYFAEQVEALLSDDFLNVLPGLLNNPSSASAVQNTLNIMQSWSGK